MPNWVTNEVKISGRSTARKEFLEMVRSEKSAFDFNKIVPMPESIEDTVAGGFTADAIYAFLRRENEPEDAYRALEAMHGVNDCFSLFPHAARYEDDYQKLLQKQPSEKHADIPAFAVFPETADEYAEVGRKYFSNIVRYGVPDWYEWSCRNWGTKWNANEASVYSDADYDVITFETAWSPPTEITFAVASMLSKIQGGNIDIQWRWAEEGGEDAGAYYLAPGKYDIVPLSGTEEGYAVCEELLGYSAISM